MGVDVVRVNDDAMEKNTHQQNDAIILTQLHENNKEEEEKRHCKLVADDASKIIPYCLLHLIPLKSNKRWFNLNLIWTLFMMLTIMRMRRIKQIKIQFFALFFLILYFILFHPREIRYGADWMNGNLIFHRDLKKNIFGIINFKTFKCNPPPYNK